MITLLRAIMLSIILTACVATGPQFTEAPQDSEKALVYFYRLPGMAFSGEKAKIFVAGVHVVSLRQGGYSWLALPPGSYEVSQEWMGETKPIKRSIEVHSGETIYFRLSTGGCYGGIYDICLGWNFDLIDPRIGAEQIKNMKLESIPGVTDLESHLQKSSTSK